jgi:hypothetical protein
MRRLLRVACFAGTALFAASAGAVDLSKIERQIAKEPSYASKNVKYCLLVFGPEAEKRVWLAWDGKDLHVDCNGNGVLTDEGEKIAGPRRPPEEDENIQLSPVALSAFGSRCTLEVALEKETCFLTLEGEGMHRHYASPKLAGTAAKAPIVHFNGPLTMALSERELFCSDKPSELFAVVGTPGLGEDSFASIGHSAVPEKAHPTAELEFPAASADAKPLRVTIELAERC